MDLLGLAQLLEFFPRLNYRSLFRYYLLKFI